MRPRTVIIIVMLGIVAIGSWILVRSQPDAGGDEIAFDSVHRGYYLKHARILGTDEDGSLLYEIEAERAEQREDQRIDFSDVQIRYSPASDVPWIVNADAATLRSGDPKIVLRGHVVIVNNGDTASGDTEVRTQYLEFDPERFVAETNERVQIRFGARSVTATGMLASLDDDKIELKANVRGKIAP